MGNSNLAALLGTILILCALTAAKEHRGTIKVTPRRSMRTLLHVLPIRAELQRLDTTLDALAAAGPNDTHALQQAVSQAWNAAKLVAEPLLEATSPSATGRRRLQQLAKLAPLDSPELRKWFNAFVQSQEQRAQAAGVNAFPALTPALTPDLLKSVGEFLNTTGRNFFVERALSNALEEAMAGFVSGDYRIKPAKRSLLQDQGAFSPKELVSLEALKAALNGLKSAAAAKVCGPARGLDLLPRGGDDDDDEFSRMRLLSNSEADVGAAASQLRRQLSATVGALEQMMDGAAIEALPAQKSLAARAAGLKHRVADLSSPAQPQRRRRLQTVDDSYAPAAEDFEGGEEYYGTYDDSSSYFEDQQPSAVVIVVQQASPGAYMAFINDALAFVMDALRAASLAPPPTWLGPSRELAIWEDEQYMYFLPEGAGAYDEYGMWTPSAEEQGEEDGYSVALDPSAPPQFRATHRRRVLSAEGDPNVRVPLDIGYDEAYGSYDYGTYDNDEAWVWSEDDGDWAGEEASLEEAVMRYADEAPDQQLLDLVVHLVAPSEGGISPALMQILADPQGASVAELLREVASGPAGSQLLMEKQGPAAHATPRFAIFGPSVLSGFSQAAAVGAQLARPMPDGVAGSSGGSGAKVVDMVVAPLHGPKPHTGSDIPTGIDARWWGVVLSLGGLGLCLVGMALATMRSEYVEVRAEEESVHGGGAAAVKQQKGAPTPTSAWENKGQTQQKSVDKAAGRKTSNLPA